MANFLLLFAFADSSAKSKAKVSAVHIEQTFGYEAVFVWFPVVAADSIPISLYEPSV